MSYIIFFNPSTLDFKMNSVSSLKPFSYFNTALPDSKQADFKAAYQQCNQEIDQLMERLMPKVIVERKGLTSTQVLQAAEEAKIAITDTFAQIDNLLLDLEKTATQPNEFKQVQLLKDEFTEIHHLVQNSNNNLFKFQRLIQEIDLLRKEGSTQDVKWGLSSQRFLKRAMFIITPALIAYLIYNNYAQRGLSELPKMASSAMSSLQSYCWKQVLTEDQQLLSCSNAYYFKDSEDHLGIEACIMNAKKQAASAFMSCFGVQDVIEMRKKMKTQLTKIHPDKNNKVSVEEFSRFANLYDFLKKNKNLNLTITDIKNCEDPKDKKVEEGIKRWASQEQKMSDYSIEKLGKKGTFSSLRCDTSPFGSFRFLEIKHLVCSSINNVCFCVTQNLGLRKKPIF